MEIRDPVHGSIELDSRFVKVIETPEYQRLRQIKQLGFSEYSFPGATHNRYLHSIGVYHLAGLAFESVFRDFRFSSDLKGKQLKTAFRLAALLHDIGHGPLSHTTEVIMPKVSELDLKVYKEHPDGERIFDLKDRQANHEDYTIKLLTESSLTSVLQDSFVGLSPIHVACLIDRRLLCGDDFFVDGGIDFRPLLSQLVSSELDVDRMDYLLRDSYFCGTNYGRVELTWLMANLTYQVSEGKAFLAINRRALYTFDDFLISRHHMNLMVYFHHKSIIYEEMLLRYLCGPDCKYQLPADVAEYVKCTDISLFEHLATSDNVWARRVADKKPFRVLVELHSTSESTRSLEMEKRLLESGLDVIHISSQTRISKYHNLSEQDRAFQIYVLDQYDRDDRPTPIEECTEIFKAYEGRRIIDRIYIAPENFEAGEEVLNRG